MKTIISLVLLGFICLSIEAQIISYSVDSEKQYSNDTKTAYLSLTGSIDESILTDIEREIMSNAEITNFSFYMNGNDIKCMYTGNISVTEAEIVQMVNDIYAVYLDSDDGQDFPNTVYGEYMKTVKFIVSGISDEGHKQQIIEDISENVAVISVEINPENICKLSVMTNVDKYMIEEIFSELNLEIIVINKR